MIVERLREHLPDRGTVGQEKAPRVGVQNGVPSLDRALVELRVAESPTADPGHMKQNVQPPREERQGLLEKPLDLSRLGRVGDDDQRRPRPDLSEIGPRRVGRLAGPAAHHDAPPSARKHRAVARPIPLVPPTIRQVRP